MNIKKIFRGKASSKVFISLIIFFLMVSMIMTYNPIKKSDSLYAVANIDKKFVYIYEDIQFSSNNSTGNIIKYNWDFGDDNFSNEPNPIHFYSKEGRYNVELIIISSTKQQDNTTIIIGVQRMNINGRSSINRLISSRNTVQGIMEICQIGPNIGNPNITTNVTLERVIGQVKINLILNINGVQRTIYSRQIQLYWQNTQIQIIIDGKEIPQEVLNTNTQLYIEIKLSEGEWRYCEYSYSVVFPIIGGLR